LRRGVLSRPVFGGVALAVACASGGVVLGITAAAKAGEPSAALTDTEPPASTEPTPDPAPPPQPKPKPKPLAKPKAAPVYHPPVHHAPVRHPVHLVRTTHTRSYVPSHRKRYAPRPAKGEPVAHHRRHRPARIAPRAKPIAVKVVTAPAKPLLPRVRAAAISAGVSTPGERDGAERAFVIVGLAFAALLFFLVVALPSTAARFTTTGRVLMDHQGDLVLAGIGALMLTALLLAITGLVS
jgi:hypothetical protein